MELNNVQIQSFLKYCFHVFRKSFLFIMVASITASFFAFFTTKMSPKIYRADAIILFVNSGGGISFGGASFFSGSSGGSGGIDGNTIKQILESRTLLEALVQKLELTRILNKGVFDSVEFLRRKIKIVNFEYKKILTISISMNNPELAAAIVNCAIDSLEEINKKLKLSTDKELVKVLDPAVPPLLPSGPSVRNNTISTFVCTAFLSYLISLVWFLIRKK